MTPSISIIIPVHNVAPYLRRCLDSVLGQTLTDIEVILVENCSTDESPAICEEYAAKDSRVKMLTISEAGPSIARNRGIEIAQGEYIGFVDGDDWIDPEMFEKLVSAARDNETGAAYCNFCFEHEEKSTEYPYPDSGATIIMDSTDVVEGILREKISSAVCTKIYRRDHFRDHKFPVGKFFEDHATGYRWLSQYDKIAWVDLPLYHYFMRDDGTTNSLFNSPSKLHDYFEAESGRLDFLDENQAKFAKHLNELRNLVIKNSFWIFKTFMRSGATDAEIEAMRQRLKELVRRYPKTDLNGKNKHNMLDIGFFWPLYRRTHKK